MAKPNEDPVEYVASCQCSAVSYTVRTTPLTSQSITGCDCSVCTRNGYMLIYIPRENVTWNRGYEKLKNFRFGPKRSDHKFCTECGSSMLPDACCSYRKLEKYEDAPDVVGLNIRMFEGIKLDGLKMTKEGWIWPPRS